MMAAREIEIARRRLLGPNGDNGRDTRDGFAPQKLLAITSGPKRQLNERASLQTAKPDLDSCYEFGQARCLR